MIMSRLATTVHVFTCVVIGVALSGCGSGAPSTASSTPSGDVVSITGTSGQLAFQPVNGGSGTASYTLVSAAPAGTTATVAAQTSGAGLPAPAGTSASVLIAFIISVNQQIEFAQFPAWQIVPPSGASLTAPYDVQVFDGTTSAGSYAATVSGSSIVASAFGPPVAVLPGHTYVYEVVENPMVQPSP